MEELIVKLSKLALKKIIKEKEYKKNVEELYKKN